MMINVFFKVDGVTYEEGSIVEIKAWNDYNIKTYKGRLCELYSDKLVIDCSAKYMAHKVELELEDVINIKLI